MIRVQIGLSALIVIVLYCVSARIPTGLYTPVAIAFTGSTKKSLLLEAETCEIGKHVSN